MIFLTNWIQFSPGTSQQCRVFTKGWLLIKWGSGQTVDGLEDQPGLSKVGPLFTFSHILSYGLFFTLANRFFFQGRSGKKRDPWLVFTSGACSQSWVSQDLGLEHFMVDCISGWWKWEPSTIEEFGTGVPEQGRRGQHQRKEERSWEGEQRTIPSGRARAGEGCGPVGCHEQ